jgi:hypothetical protein
VFFATATEYLLAVKYQFLSINQSIERVVIATVVRYCFLVSLNNIDYPSGKNANYSLVVGEVILQQLERAGEKTRRASKGYVTNEAFGHAPKSPLFLILDLLVQFFVSLQSEPYRLAQ